MLTMSDYNEEQLTALKEREQREHFFNILGKIIAAIIIAVFAITKLQS